MGNQRSGTNILRESLEFDENIASYNESRGNLLFKNWYLRPQSELLDAIKKINKNILLKPISENKGKGIKEVLNIFQDYKTILIYIFRDPVNVYYSSAMKWGVGLQDFIKDWNDRNQDLLDKYQSIKDKCLIVNYEDLSKSKKYFEDLCRKINIKGKYNFRKDSSKGYEHLSENVINIIKIETKEVLKKLNNVKSLF